MGDRQFRTYDTSALQPKRSKGPMIAFIAVIVVVALLLILGVSTLVRGCTSGNLVADGQQVTVEVADGASTSSIAQSLQEAGLVSSASDFTKKVSDLGLDGSLQPGTYTLTGGMSLEDLAKTLSAGPGLSGPSVTIPEGLTLANIADRVSSATNGRISADDFKAQASNASVYAGDFPFLKDAGTNSLEGFLFPKTYAVSATDTADSLIRTMLSQYQTEVATLDYSYPTSKNFNAYQTLILASIIEKEASEDADIRAKVSAVFYNRLLNTGAPTYGLLGSDATTAYEIGGDPDNYDWTTDSAYNTRRHAGLPPTPICSPSIGSLQAACNPASDFDDYYFFSFWPNDQGTIDYFFDKTYDEHQATIAAHS